MVRRRSLLLLFLVALAALGSSQAAVGSAAKKHAAAGKKVAICHRTASEVKPYVRMKVAKRAALQGHQRHAADLIPAPAEGCPTTVLSPTAGGTALAATLTGAAEVPGPGDPDGSGSATIRLRAGQAQICYGLTVAGITLPATAAHIHEGAAGVAGPPVVTLEAPGATGATAGCVRVARPLAAAILASPGSYYVNVHTADFPDGAVRGQLAL